MSCFIFSCHLDIKQFANKYCNTKLVSLKSEIYEHISSSNAYHCNVVFNAITKLLEPPVNIFKVDM